MERVHSFEADLAPTIADAHITQMQTTLVAAGNESDTKRHFDNMHSNQYDRSNSNLKLDVYYIFCTVCSSMKRRRDTIPDDGPPPKACALQSQANERSLQALLAAAEDAFNYAVGVYRKSLWEQERRTLNTLSIVVHSGDGVAFAPLDTDFAVSEAMTHGIIAQLRSTDTKRFLRGRLHKQGYALAEDSEPFITYFSYSLHKGRSKPLAYFADPTETFYALVDRHVPLM
mgnify:CR=1 FL=1